MNPIEELRRELEADSEARRRLNQRSWAREAFPGTAGGAALTAAPVTQHVTRVPAVVSARNPTRGQCLHVAAHETIPDATLTPVTFTTVIGPTTLGFFSTTTAIPTADLFAPFSGVSQVTVRVAWDDVAAAGWHGDGSMAILKVNGLLVDAWVADDPALLPVAPLQTDSVKIPIETDDVLTLELYQTSGEARDATVSLSWGLEDERLVAPTPATALVQARVWEDGGSEPGTWQAEAITPAVAGLLFPALDVTVVSDNGVRQCDWLGWGPTGTAPEPGGGGHLTDFCEAEHTLGQPPAGWTQIKGTDRIIVNTLAASNSPCGRSALSANWSSGNNHGISLWTDTPPVSALNVVEITAALRSTQSGINPPSVGVMTPSGSGWQAQPRNLNNDLIIRTMLGGDRGPDVATAGMTLSPNTWYRVRLRITAGEL